MKTLLKVVIMTIFLICAQQLESQTVYVTKTGKKYHLEGCQSLSKSSIPISLSDAKAKGYTPCGTCRPDNSVKPQSKNTNAGQIEKKSESAPPQQSKQTTTSNIDKSVKTQCTAITKKGTRCSRKTSSQNGKCWQHGGN